MKKPDMAVIVGIGAAKPKRSGMAPPSFARKSVAKEAAAEGEPVAQEQQEKASPMGDTDDQTTHGMDVSPEAVCYRTAEETCGNCQRMGQDGQCSLLKIPVSAGDSCNAFIASERGATDMPMESQEAPGPEVA